MRTILILITILISSLVINAQSGTPSPMATPVSFKPCTAKAVDIPAIRGLKLGMETKELEMLLNNASPHIALAISGFLYPFQFKDHEQYKGIQRVGYDFYKEKLSAFTIIYNDGIDWKNTREFAMSVATNLHLPTESYLGPISSPGMSCSDFFLLVQDKKITIRDTVADKNADETEKAEAERKKKAFKP